MDFSSSTMRSLAMMCLSLCEEDKTVPLDVDGPCPVWNGYGQGILGQALPALPAEAGEYVGHQPTRQGNSTGLDAVHHEGQERLVQRDQGPIHGDEDRVRQ